MTTMRRRKEWLLQRQLESIRSKESPFARWAKWFLKGFNKMASVIAAGLNRLAAVFRSLQATVQKAKQEKK